MNPAVTLRPRDCKRMFLFMAALASLALLVACGSSSSSSVAPPTPVNNTLLNGQYAFTFSGQNANGILSAVGSFTADGKGNITGGTEDINSAIGAFTLSFTGSYSIGSDNRGIATLSTSNGPATWQFTMVNGTHALLVRFDSFATASGSIDRQDAAAFNLAALTGNYVFNFAGLGLNGGNIALAGAWTMDGAGNIGVGVLDVNDTGAVIIASPLSGTYSLSSSTNGRGLATISSGKGTQNFVFYIVNQRDLKFLEIDALPVSSGEVLQEAAGPFGDASLHGSIAFTVGGESAGLQPLASGGILAADGGGVLTSVILDDNNDGAVSLNQQFTGNYSVSSTGRGSLSFGTLQFAFYVAANGTVELVEIDAGAITSGFGKFQSAGPFNAGTLSGNYALDFSGTNLSAFSEEDIGGILAPNGSGTLAGTLDINSAGTLLQGVALTGSNYTMTANGRGTASLNSSLASFSMQMYQVDANTVLFLEIDNLRVITGLAQK